MLKELATSSCPYCEEPVGPELATTALEESEAKEAARGYISENGFRVTCSTCHGEFFFRDGDHTVAPLTMSKNSASDDAEHGS